MISHRSYTRILEIARTKPISTLTKQKFQKLQRNFVSPSGISPIKYPEHKTPLSSPSKNTAYLKVRLPNTYRQIELPSLHT